MSFEGEGGHAAGTVADEARVGPIPVLRFDVVVVGAGPAGMAAAVRASGDGRRVALVDDNPSPGGQIWRNEARRPSGRESRRWFALAAAAPIERLHSTRIVGTGGPGVLVAEGGGRLVELAYDRLILTPGARELFLPFPGWTLPNAMGAGGLQAMSKSGLPVAGKTVVVAGSGPLLLAVASALKAKGAKVVAIVEQAPPARVARFALALRSEPGKLAQAVGLKLDLGLIPYRLGWWPVEAEAGPDGAIARVRITNGRRSKVLDCDYLACGFGLLPNLELPRLLGCAIDPATGGATRVDPFGMTSIPGVSAAGEVAGVGGLETATLEGEIAGYAAADRLDRACNLLPALGKARRFADALRVAFAPRDELKHLCRPDTVVCRCEDVPARALLDRTSWVDAKLQTRCGMGPCQGRICGGAVAFLHGWEPPSVRPPLFPIEVEHLAEYYQAAGQVAVGSR